MKPELRFAIVRSGRVWRYACGKSTLDDNWAFYREVEESTGWWTLESLDESAVLERAIEMYGEQPGLDALVSDACARVAHRWDSSGHTRDTAQDWAFDLIRQNASDYGVDISADALTDAEWQEAPCAE
jgi:hypothetical protein